MELICWGQSGESGALMGVDGERKDVEGRGFMRGFIMTQ